MNTTTTTVHADAPTFEGLGITPQILTTLDKLGLTNPTPIQHQAIPVGIEGKDLVGIAQTGTGKTLAFGIPLLQRISDMKQVMQVRPASHSHGLVLLPTRELALQVHESLGAIARPLGLRGVSLIGGASMRPQVMSLRHPQDVIIATPGRLLDHLRQGTVKLDHVGILVLDEADRMLDMGFWPQIKEIIARLPKERQTFAFSATLSREVMDLMNKHMRSPVSIEVSPSGTTADRVSQEFFMVRKEEKMRLLESVLETHTGSAIVFTRTKHGATRVMRGIKAMGHTTAEIHSNRSLGQRRDALEGFKSGRFRVLVATDIAARGIDVKDVALVINYDLPSQPADYVHRIGRTARAGAEGHAISFAEANQRRDMRDIERLIRMQIPMSPTPVLPPARTPVTESPTHDNGRGNHTTSSYGHKRVQWRNGRQTSARPVGRGQRTAPPSGGYTRSRSVHARQA